MDSPSESRIMCKKQFAWAYGFTSETEKQAHGSGRAVATELIHSLEVQEAPS